MRSEVEESSSVLESFMEVMVRSDTMTPSSLHPISGRIAELGSADVIDTVADIHTTTLLSFYRRQVNRKRRPDIIRCPQHPVEGHRYGQPSRSTSTRYEFAQFLSTIRVAAT